MILGWMAYGQSKSENSISSSSKNYLIRWRGLTYAACLCILYPGVIATGHTQQTSRSSHLSLMFSYHSLLLLLFVADKNPSQGAATTITAVCFDPSFDTEQQRSEVLPYPIRLLSDHRSIPMSCVRMWVRLFAISYGNWVVRRKSRWTYSRDRILCLWCSPLKGMNGWMVGDESMDDDDE